MNPGKRDRIAHLFGKTFNTDTAGAPTEVWTAVEDLWVSKPQLTTGKLAEIAGKTATSAMYSFEAQYRPTVKPLMRMVIEGVTFDIVTVFEQGRRAGMMVTASVVT